MQPDQTFGRFVRQRRRELDLTQEELARRVGCAAITIRKVETDEAHPSVQIAERLAMALAIPLDDRAEFVHRARTARPDTAELPALAEALEQIGQEDLTGHAIRGYALAEKLGAGGMGVVYRAVQPLVEREVAVKIILPGFANHPDFIRRFESEAQVVARLEHPHIVPLYDYWREPGVAYLVMRLLRGGSVQTLLQNGPLPVEVTLRVLEQVCAALHHAHRHGIIHRDLKPANILLDEDQNVYLADFGIAKNLSQANREGQTEMDAVVGSPEYMSPEQIRSLTVRPQSDIYCLGVMLYQMLTGTLPFSGPTPFDLIQHHILTPMPPLAAQRTGLPAALDAVISCATAKEPDERYADALLMLKDFRRAFEPGATIVPVVAPVEAEEEAGEISNPYKGLRAFNEADAEDFFGRDTLVQQLLARLSEEGELARFLAVIGPSGSGKSSVVRAGLVPALRRGGLLGSENWFYVDFLPGPRPFEELEAALLRVAVNPPASLLEQLKGDARGLLRAVNRILPSANAATGQPPVELVLVIDQFEELFTLLPDEAERVLFLNNLVTAVLDERSRVRVIVTLRADFIDRPLRYVDFGELVQRRSELVLSLTPDELERAIVGPARRVGLRLEPGLTSAMMREVGDQPGALPLLQYALTELYEMRVGNTLTRAAYQSIGGVLGALGRRAEEVYGQLDETGQAAIRQLFLRLVTLGEGVEDTRRRVLRSELEAISHQPAAIHHAIDVFGRSHLLAFDRDQATHSPTVEVAHEALLREWPRLREWLNESRADVRLQRQLALAAADWQNANRDASYLLNGAKLEQFEGWALNTGVALTGDEQTYLTASLAERDRREAQEREREHRELEAARKLVESERQSAARLRFRNRAITVVGAIALALAVLAGLFSLQASQNASEAQNNLGAAHLANTQSAASAATAQAASLLAEERRNTALNAQATAEAERQRAEKEQRIATSRELAIAAISNLSVDPERSILLALEALKSNYTPEAEDALHRAILASRVQLTLYHSAAVWDIAYSPDGTHLATTSADGTTKIWEAATGRELLTLNTGTVYGLAFSPDGTRLATAHFDAKLGAVWEVSTGRRVFTLLGHTAGVNQITFSPDGTRLATASDDGTARVWEAATGKALFTLTGHTNFVASVAFSPDGTQLITGGWDSTVRVWEAATGREIPTFPAFSEPTEAVFSPDNVHVAIAVGSEAQIWNLATGEKTLALAGHTTVIYHLAFSADGEKLVTAANDGIAKIWDADTGANLLTLAGHAATLYGAAFSPNGAFLATASQDGSARVWDITPAGSREWLTITAHNAWARRVAYSPNGQQLVTASYDGTAKIFSATSGESVQTFVGHEGRVYAAVFSPDGTRVATAGEDKTARVWDVATGQQLLVLNGHGAGLVDGLLSGVLALAYSPDGKLLATAGADGKAIVWEAATGQQVHAFANNGIGLTDVAFSPNNVFVAFATDQRPAAGAGEDATAQLWDAVVGKPIFTVSQSVRVWSLAFSPDGKRLATAGFGGLVKIRAAHTGEELLSLSGHTSTVIGVAFSPDGRYIATVSPGDGTTKLWDAQTGLELLTLAGHTGSITGVAFSPDGTRLATSGQDGTVRVYVLQIEELIALGQARVTRTLTTPECQKYLHLAACP